MARLPPRRRVPLPDVRRPRPRRQPARGAAAQRGRIRPRRAGRVPGARSTRPEVTVGGHRPATRWAGSGRSWRPPPTRASRPSSRRSTPADPYRLTRQTFRLAHLPIPDPIAYPLAWLTTRVYLRPRGHVVARRQRHGGDRPVRRARSCSPTATRTAWSRRATWNGWLRRRAASRADRARRRAGRDAPRRGRPALVAVRVPGLPSRRRGVPRARARRAARPGRSRRPGRRDAAGADPRWRGAVRCGRPRRPAASGRSPRSPCPARPAPARARRRRRRRRSASPIGASRRTVTDSRRTPSGPRSRRSGPIRRFADRPLEPEHLERILARRPARRQLQEPAALDVHRVPRPGAPARARRGRAVGRPSRRRGGRDRARDARPARVRRAAVDHVRPRPGRGEHDAGRLGARDRERAGHRLRPRPGARRLLGYPADHHCEFLLSFGYPADPTDLTRPPRRVAAAVSTRSCTRNAGSAVARRPNGGRAGYGARRGPCWTSPTQRSPGVHSSGFDPRIGSQFRSGRFGHDRCGADRTPRGRRQAYGTPDRADSCWTGTSGFPERPR